MKRLFLLGKDMLKPKHVRSTIINLKCPFFFAIGVFKKNVFCAVLATVTAFVGIIPNGRLVFLSWREKNNFLFYVATICTRFKPAIIAFSAIVACGR